MQNLLPGGKLLPQLLQIIKMIIPFIAKCKAY